MGKYMRLPRKRSSKRRFKMNSRNAPLSPRSMSLLREEEGVESYTRSCTSKEGRFHGIESCERTNHPSRWILSAANLTLRLNRRYQGDLWSRSHWITLNKIGSNSRNRLKWKRLKKLLKIKKMSQKLQSLNHNLINSLYSKKKSTTIWTNP